MKKLYNVSSKFSNLVYFKPTDFIFDFARELYRYEYIKMMRTRFTKTNSVLYWGLVIGNDDRDPLITLANEKIFNILKLPLNKLNEWNSCVNEFIESKTPFNKCSVDDIKVSFKNDVCYLKCDILDKEYNILKSKYKSKYKGEIFSCLLRYDILTFLTPMSGAVRPEIYDYLHDKYYCNIELFASFFNSRLKYYFGLFYDLEKYFGCLGNFFKSKLKSGFFVANPPFNLEFMNMFFDKIKNELEKNNIVVYMTVPVWDNIDRKTINKHCPNDKSLQTNYDSVFNIHILDKYLILNRLFCKSKYTFYDYLTQMHIHFSPVNVLVVSSKTIKINMNSIDKNYIKK
jgi:hypothetical protein